MSVKCLLVDDEPLAIRVLENHIEKVPWLEIAGKSNNPIEAIEVLNSTRIDLLFLDIQMPELSGIDFIRSLKHPPVVIFTTAYRQFAADAFDLDGLDYLVKPISLPRFLKSVNKYLEIHGERKGLKVLDSVNTTERRSFFIRKGREMIRIYVDEILWIEGLKDYVQIFLADQKFIYKAKLSDLEEELEEDHFLRVHKSYLVPVRKIEAVSPVDLKIAGKTIPIGRLYKASVLKRLSLSR